MRYLLSLLVSTLAALAQPMDAAFLGSLGSAAAPPPTYIVSESFDTNPGYDLGASWVEGGTGTKDADYTITILEGTQSLFLGGTTKSAYTQIGCAGGEVWAYCLFRADTIPAGDQALMAFRDGSGSIGRIIIKSTGLLVIYNGTVNATTVDAISAGVTYSIWLYYKKGTGADGVATVAFSTTTTKPTSGNKYQSVSTGDATTDSITFRLGSSGVDTFGFIYDHLRTDDANIGDNPP